MLGIQAIGVYIPAGRISNFEFKERFEIDDAFIRDKIGFTSVAVVAPDEGTNQLCLKALTDLQSRVTLALNEIECLVVVTQNPDTNIPHTSAMLHGALGLPTSCACFDVSLACSGYVYGLSLIQSFMASNGLKKGLLFTADPYSKVIDRNDKNTTLLFGDAGTVTLVGPEPKYVSGAFNFGTIGKDANELTVGTCLTMNGRAIYNFAGRHVPPDVRALVKKYDLELGQIDRFVFHQGSKFLIDTLAKLLGVNRDKMPFAAAEYGNTVSSSIPILLQKELATGEANRILISGFGAGLSWGSTILTKV
jgi:3-oxoacyl-[acyl-carrier-protein] synthase-3